MAFCQKCGCALPDDAAFCTQCGEKNVMLSKNNSSSKKSIWFLIVIVCIVGVGFFYFNPFSTKYYFESSLIDGYAKALSNANAEDFLHTIYPSEAYVQISDEQINSLTDDMKFANGIMQSFYNSSSPKYSMSISDKYKLDQDELNEIQHFYSYNYGITVEPEKGYLVTVKMSVVGQKDTINLEIYYTKKDGWKITPNTGLYLLNRG